MPNHNDIQQKLSEYLIAECNLREEDFGPDTGLFSDGLVDSIRIVGILDFCESTFGVKISPFDVHPDNFDSISRIAGFICDLTQRKAA